LRIIGVNDRIHHCFTNSYQRYGLAFLAADIVNDGLHRQMLLRKGNGLFNGHGRHGTDRQRIDQSNPIGSRKSTGLNPGIGELREAIHTKKNEALMLCSHAEGFPSLALRGASQRL